jgi:hypothetical protein
MEELGLDEFFNPDRCQGMCKACHDRKTAFECGWVGSKGTATQTVDLTDDCCKHITVVCGLAGSGKSHYVNTHAAQGDLVWDFDVTMAEATGREMHATTPTGALQSMLAQRDAFVERARWSNQHAWIIVSRPDAALTLLLASAGAELVLLEIDEAERLQRLVDRGVTPSGAPSC